MQKLIIWSLVAASFLLIAPTTAMADPPFVEIRISTQRPPAVRREVRVVRPAPDHVWVAGYWDWQGGQWTWVDGRWMRPEPRARWVRPAYVAEYGSWRYVPGHWSTWTVREGDDYRSWKEERKAHKHNKHKHKHKGHHHK